MEHPARRIAVDTLRRADIRVTVPRIAVLTALVLRDGHASADEVLETALTVESTVTRATVYRTLERLRDERLISETDLGDGVRRFEIVDDVPHHHLICTGCGAIIDLDDHAIDALRESIERDYGFRADIDHLALFGRCPVCRMHAR